MPLPSPLQCRSPALPARVLLGRRPAQRGNALIVCMGRRAAKIANRKGKADAAKAKLYGKFGKLIIQAAKENPDPESNAALRDVIAQAKSAGCPKDIIDRNLSRSKDKSGADFQEVTYEAYGPGGSGFIVESLTDNVNRTASDVKSTITKAGCKNAEPGSVLFNFTKRGVVVIPAEGVDEEQLFEDAVDAGADDIVPGDDVEGGSFRVVTEVEDFGACFKALSDKYNTQKEESGLKWIPNTEVELDGEDMGTCEDLFEKLLELDDVDAVYATVAGLNN
ncbi:unnamed protein product [Pedinophyceae sp. YPF-701]|nr:unnamed protein product [Pedinophyceae sp. YPF-701]